MGDNGNTSGEPSSPAVPPASSLPASPERGFAGQANKACVASGVAGQPPASAQAYRWDLAPRWGGAAELAGKLRTGELIAQLLHNRGYSDAQAASAFMSPKLSDLIDPEQLSGVPAAAERIFAAIRDGCKIVLYGDYDVDGMAGVAILYRALKRLGAQVDYYIPHRVDEGYGLNEPAIEQLAANGCGLLVTVDCGIRSERCLARAGELKLPVIITDHHAIEGELPRAEVVVHPGLAGYANADLCGAGVALKLAWQICRTATGARKVSEELREFLLDATCLAALGTIADVVPLRGENRVLATYGLKGLAQTRHVGLRALITASGILGRQVGAYDVGFLLAPRLNAAGRMGHARDAAELLVRPEEIAAEQVARALAAVNVERQRVEAQTYEQAAQMVTQLGYDAPEHRAIVLAAEGWHPGVIGIVAARLVRQFHRPTILIALDGDTGAGSGRSISGFHLASALTACSAHLKDFGGHAMAAGLKIERGRIDAFRAALLEHAGGLISPAAMAPALTIDAEVNLGVLAVPLVHQVEQMAPFGAGNPPVILAVRAAVMHAPPRRMGARGSTLGLLLTGSAGPVRCVGFGMGDLVDRLAGRRQIDVAGEPVINRYNGRESVELHLKDLQC